MLNRQSHRLSGYDYSCNGAYFITVLCQDRKERYGEVVHGSMVLNDAGKMVASVWEDLPERYPMVRLDCFVIMPNHIHGILVLDDGIPRRGGSCIRPGINDSVDFIERVETALQVVQIGIK